MLEVPQPSAPRLRAQTPTLGTLLYHVQDKTLEMILAITWSLNEIPEFSHLCSGAIAFPGFPICRQMD